MSNLPSITGEQLMNLISADLGPSRMRGHRLFWLCPFHDDRNPSLTIMPDQTRWICFAGCGHGDAIDWVKKRRDCSFNEAVAFLGGDPSQTWANVPRKRARAVEKPRTADPEWSGKAEAIARECTKALLESSGKRALVWLINRGLKRGTLSRWQIGFNAEDQKRHGLSVKRGITIPWILNGRVVAVNVRRPFGDTKYEMVGGSMRRGLYLADTIVPGRFTLLTEGEFDALLAWQIVGDLVNVASLGSAGTRPDRDAVRLLIASPRILVAYDADDAGRDGAAFLGDLTARAYRLPIPTGKDITEFHQRGGDVRMWIRQQLEHSRT